MILSERYWVFIASNFSWDTPNAWNIEFIIGIFFLQQRVKSSSTADHLRELASHYTQAEAKVQQLEKMRPLYEDYVKLVLKTVPATEKMTMELEQELESKSQALNDV